MGVSGDVVGDAELGALEDVVGDAGLGVVRCWVENSEGVDGGEELRDQGHREKAALP